jgi:hypothetical protein
MTISRGGNDLITISFYTYPVAWCPHGIPREKPAAVGVKAPYPGLIEPALASSIEEVPTGDRWIHEIKFDGYRVQAAPDHGEVLGVADAADHGGAHGDGFGSEI